MNRRLFVRWGLTGAATAFGGAAFAATRHAAKGAAPAPQPAGKSDAGAGLDIAEGEMVLGRADAPVEIIEYASMTCTHCAHFELTILPELQKRYIDTGKVKLVFREFPLDALALRGAMLARCAGPDRFFGVLQLLFQQQETWAQGKNPEAALERIGALAGISKDQFNACMADKALMDKIVQSRMDAEKAHQIESTPSFVINGKVHTGAETIDDLAKVIDPLLTKS